MSKNYIGPRDLNRKKKVEKALKQKSLSTLKSDLQKVFNLFIRLRDTIYLNGKAYFVCISCGNRKEIDQMHAGHFFSVGGHPSVRFDEDNAHGQCAYCNTFQHGNLYKYSENLQKKIGDSRFNMLCIRAKNRSKLMPFEVEMLIDQYQEKIKKLKNKS